MCLQTVFQDRQLPLLFLMAWRATLGLHKDLRALESSHNIGVDVSPPPTLMPQGWGVRGCNVNRPVQGWVGPEVNEAKTRLSGKASRRRYHENENKQQQVPLLKRPTHITSHPFWDNLMRQVLAHLLLQPQLL